MKTQATDNLRTNKYKNRSDEQIQTYTHLTTAHGLPPATYLRSLLTRGIRVVPPTNTTSSISSLRMSDSANGSRTQCKPKISMYVDELSRVHSLENGHLPKSFRRRSTGASPRSNRPLQPCSKSSRLISKRASTPWNKAPKQRSYEAVKVKREQ